MPNLASTGKDAGSIAVKILTEWESRPQSVLRSHSVLWREVATARDLARQAPPASTLEAERIDVLLGAVESLESNAPERVRAALYVLDHLANAESRR